MRSVVNDNPNIHPGRQVADRGAKCDPNLCPALPRSWPLPPEPVRDGSGWLLRIGNLCPATDPAVLSPTLDVEFDADDDGKADHVCRVAVGFVDGDNDGRITRDGNDFIRLDPKRAEKTVAGVALCCDDACTLKIVRTAAAMLLGLPPRA